MDRQLQQLKPVLPETVWRVLQELPEDILEEVTELRLRAGMASTVTYRGGTLFLSMVGAVTPVCDRPVNLSELELANVFAALCRNSVYARSEELANGFVTYRGCRAGICGTAVRESGAVVGFRNISAINLRIAREHPGAAKELLEIVLEGDRVHSILLASPPGCGKTTMLRDLCRLLSLRRYRVAVIDERSEIAGEAGHRFDLATADVLSGLPKSEGMEMALRTLAPQVLVIDELGGEAEVRGLLACLNAGVPVIASCHASTLEQLIRRPQVRMLQQAGALERVVLLAEREIGTIKAVYDVGEFHGEDTGGAADRTGMRRSGLLELG